MPSFPNPDKKTLAIDPLNDILAEVLQKLIRPPKEYFLLLDVRIMPDMIRYSIPHPRADFF